MGQDPGRTEPGYGGRGTFPRSYNVECKIPKDGFIGKRYSPVVPHHPILPPEGNSDFREVEPTVSGPVSSV